MKITNEFAVNTPIEQAWAVLTDLEGIAPCLPGAQLTGVDGDVYRGKVKVKVGPVVSEFAGTARFVEKDEAQYRGVIDAKGQDARSAGNASALVTAQLRPDGDRTLVSVDTDLKISGRLAQFGRGMINDVSGKLLAQFVSNLEAKLTAEEAGTASSEVEPAGSPAVPVARPEPESATAASPAAVMTTPSTAVHPGPVEPAAVEPAPVEPAPVGPAPVEPAAASTRSAPATAERESTSPPTQAEPEALDLLGIAGGSIVKRLVPVLVGIVAVGAVIAWLVARR